jgi:hypothetical protein
MLVAVLDEVATRPSFISPSSYSSSTTDQETWFDHWVESRTWSLEAEGKRYLRPHGRLARRLDACLGLRPPFFVDLACG